MKKRIEKFMTDSNFLGDHIFVKEPPRRCWQFQRYRNGEISWCPYGFIFSYHPGCFSLWGDIGNLQINHYSSIDSNLEGSLHWLAFSCSEYLLSKSNAENVYSPSLSADYIWQDMMRYATDNAISYRKIIREWISNGKPAPRPERPEEIDKLFVDLSDYILGDFYPNEERSGLRKDLRDDLKSHLCDGEVLVYEIAENVLEVDDPHVYVRQDRKDGTAEKIAAMKFAAREILVREFGRDPKTPEAPVVGGAA